MSNIQIPSEFTRVVKERLKIVSDYEKSIFHTIQLGDLSSEVDEVDSIKPIDELVDKESLPKELASAVILLKKKLTEIDQLEKAIYNGQLKIDEIEVRFSRIMIGIAVAGVTVVLFSLLVIFG